MRKFLIFRYKLLLLIVLVVGLFVLFAYSYGKQQRSILQGYIEGKYTYLAPAVSGKLEQLLVDRGVQVKNGQLLFALDKEPELSQLQKTQERLAQTQQTLADLIKGQRQTVLQQIGAEKLQAAANLDFTEKTLIRYKELYAQKVIDKSTLDRAQSDYTASLQHVKAFEARLSEARQGARENLINAQKFAVAGDMADVRHMQWAVSQKTVVAPSDALVFDKLHEMGEFIAAGDPVVILLPQNTLKVIFFVPERYLGKIKLGEQIAMSCSACKERFPAIISFISPNAEFTPPVIFSVESRDKLVYRIEAKINPNLVRQFHTGQPVDVYMNY